MQYRGRDHLFVLFPMKSKQVRDFDQVIDIR